MPVIIGLILLGLALWLGAKAIGFILLSTIVLGDGLSHVLALVGVDEPITGWLILGILIGGAVGAVIGMRRAGRPLSRAALILGTGLAILLLGGASALAPRSDDPPAFSARPAPTHPSLVYIVPEQLSVRAGPSPSARSIGMLARETSLQVDSVDLSGRWYAVTVRKNNRPIVGWVSTAYVSSTPPVPPPPQPVAARPTQADTFEIATVGVGRGLLPNGRLAEHVDEFSSFDTIYTTVATRNPGVGKLTVLWAFEDGQPVQTDSLTLTAHGDASTRFQLAKTEGLAAGRYALHVQLNDVEVYGRQVTVK